VFFLTKAWMPLGAQNTLFGNFLFVIVIVAIVLGALSCIVKFYPGILEWALNNKWKFLAAPMLIVMFGLTAWLGVIVTSMDAGVNKPRPEIFRYALKQAGIQPEESIYVGDQYQVAAVIFVGVDQTSFPVGRCFICHNALPIIVLFNSLNE